MKITPILAAVTACLCMASPSPALAASSAGQCQCEKTYTGNVTGVDVQNHILSVRGFLFTKNFVTGADCKVSLQDKATAALNDLRPGEEVTVRFQDNNGVLIARAIAQHDLVYSGHIKAIDPQKGTLLVRHGAMTHEFSIAPTCSVTLRDNKAANVNNLQLGDAVNVVYERVNGAHVIQRIEQNSATFVGTISAVDTTTRMVKARDARGAEKQFSLADNCSIVINGKLSDSLYNLQTGEQAMFDYNNVDGVLVANRVSPVAGPAPAAPRPVNTAEQRGQWHAYNSYNY